MLSGDHGMVIETRPLTGAWYAPDFMTATYSSRLSDAATQLGVFQVSGDALLLQGVVSPDDGGTRTELTYDPPAKVLSFPISLSSTWTSDSSITGTGMGVPVLYSERYESQVDAQGELVTPFGSFAVLRIQVLLTRTVGFAVTTVRSFIYVTECFGVVATITSQPWESEV